MKPKTTKMKRKQQPVVNPKAYICLFTSILFFLASVILLQRFIMPDPDRIELLRCLALFLCSLGLFTATVLRPVILNWYAKNRHR